MNRYSLTHVGDGDLLCSTKAVVARDHGSDADVLAHIAEIDDRRLFLPAAHPSMHSYCVHELRFSDEAADKRINAARAARRFPAIFPMVADGRLHLAAVVMLAPRLTPENADELLAEATDKTKAEIGLLLAQRFPRPDRPDRLTSRASNQPAPGRVQATIPEQPVHGRVESPATRGTVTPLSPQRFALEITLTQAGHDNLQYAHALLSQEMPAGNLSAVTELAYAALVEKLEKRKFAATGRPRMGSRRCASARHIPAAVKRSVLERDEGQCTFVSDAGKRCPSRMRLEFDHAQMVARGGQATVENIRLRCRAHNQYEAERAFGVDFMNHKRREARARKEAAQRHAAERVASVQHAPRHVDAQAPEESNDRDVIPWLRKLGVRPADARYAAELCESIPDASLEERVRLALRHLMPPHRRVPAPPAHRFSGGPQNA